jgi:hypothetical protein
MLARVCFFLFLCFLQAFPFQAADSSRRGSNAVYIPARDYFSILTAEISKARSSVFAAVYLFALYPSRSEAQTTQLADALVAAQKRGVTVRVVLDKGETSDAGEVNANNRMAYEYLRAHGIDAYFADVPAVMHAKAVILDSETVIMGSANWSEAAFQKNTEAGGLTRSKEYALAALAELGKIPALALPEQDTTAVRVPVKFLTENGFLDRIVSSKDDRAFDFYLYLLSHSCASPETLLVINYDTLGKTLGMDSIKPLARTQMIYQASRRLRDKYKLIEDYKQSLPDIKVRIKALPGETIALPQEYFTWGRDRLLAFPAKVMEMLSLYYSSISGIRPKWSLAVRTIAQQHGFDKNFVSRGTTALRQKNLIDVEYFEWPLEGEDPRHPNVYMPLPLYDPAALAAKWQKLETKYGKEKTDRARRCAEIVFKDCDPIAVEKLIGLEEKYGIDKMEKASKIISALRADNPHRCLEYYFGVLRKLE